MRACVVGLAPALLLFTGLTSAATAEASGSGAERLEVWGHEAEVMVADADELHITVNGETWTYQRYPGGSSVSGPAAAQTDPQLVDAIVKEWERLNPEWVDPPAPRSPWRIPLGLAVIGLGGTEVWHPRFFWFLSDGWRFRNAEPSDLALGLERLGGVITVVVGLVILFY